MELANLITRIDQAKAELDALRPIDPLQERQILQKFHIDWTYHSNAIEGNTLTYGETKALILHGLTAQGKPLKDYLDIRGHQRAIDYLTEFVRREQQLTEADIRHMHKILLDEPYQMDAVTPSGQPTKRWIAVGQYKTAPNSVETSTGKLHIYASPEETPAMMGDLMKWYRQELEGDLHPLILAATFHYKFVAIHPFDDGNGRMARLLMNLILMQGGYVPVVVKNEGRNEYIFTLEQADSGDLDPFILHVGKELETSLDLFIRGANGENIETLTDFDEKIFLLQKRLEYKNHQNQVTFEMIELWFDNFVVPFLILLQEKMKPIFEMFSDQLIEYCWYENFETSLKEGLKFEVADNIDPHLVNVLKPKFSSPIYDQLSEDTPRGFSIFLALRDFALENSDLTIHLYFSASKDSFWVNKEIFSFEILPDGSRKGGGDIYSPKSIYKAKLSESDYESTDIENAVSRLANEIADELRKMSS